jgi:hypothetical protein
VAGVGDEQFVGHGVRGPAAVTSSKRPSRRRVRYGGQDEQTGVYRPVTWDFIK